MELVDPRLESSLKKDEVLEAIHVGLLCTSVEASERPTMSAVVSMLEGRAGVSELFSDNNVPMTNPKDVTDHDGRVQSASMDVPWTVSSASTGDLYPITVDTEYWEKRDL